MKNLKKRLTSVCLVIALVAVMIPTAFTTPAQAASYYVWTAGYSINPGDTKSFNFGADGSCAANCYPTTPTQSGWYEFRSIKPSSPFENAGDPFLVITTNKSSIETQLTTNGRIGSTEASKLNNVVAYNDDGGGSPHFYAKVYLYANITYYVYCTRYSTGVSNEKYQLQYTKSSDTSYPLLSSSAISVGDSPTVTLSNDKPAYCYSFTAPCSGTFRVTSSNHSTAPSIDPFVVISTVTTAANSVYDYARKNGGLSSVPTNAGGYVIKDDDSSGNLEFGTNFAMNSGQTYYIVCGRNSQNSSRGSYTVSVSRVYNVLFDANGGANVPSARLAYGSTNVVSFTVPETPMPTCEGYTFAGWNTKADGTGTTYQPGSAVSNLPTTTTTADVNLYAQWAEHTATLTYDANGHGTAPEAVEMKYTVATNAATAPTATGYTFSKWTTNQDGTGTSYTAGAQVKAANVDPVATTLYAQWTENTATLTYNNNGHGTAPGSLLMTFTKAAQTAAAIGGVTGYTFKEWNTAADGNGNSYAPGAEIKAENTDPEETTLYAQWGEHKYRYTLEEAPTLTKEGTYTRITYYTDKNGDTVVDTKPGNTVSFKAWYLRTMVQYREDNHRQIRFVSMLDEHLENYKEAGFIFTVGDAQEITVSTVEAQKSYLADGDKTYTIGQFSKADDYFFLAKTEFESGVSEDAVITVKPYVMLMNGEKIEGEPITFKLSDLH